MTLQDHFATQADIICVVESAKNKLLSADIKLPLTTKGILCLEWVAHQELAREEKCGTFRLISDGTLKDVIILFGDEAFGGWEDFDTFEQDGKSYVMYPNPFHR